MLYGGQQAGTCQSEQLCPLAGCLVQLADQAPTAAKFGADRLHPAGNDDSLQDGGPCAEQTPLYALSGQLPQQGRATCPAAVPVLPQPSERALPLLASLLSGV